MSRGLASLRRFLVDSVDKEPAPEVCELCAKPVPPQHPHLVQVAQRRMLCACGPCGFLFSNPGAGAGEYRRVPDRYLDDPAFELTDGQWDALQIPVGMAFFLHNSAQNKIIACYPSPAGATESELEMDAFATGVGAGRLGAALEPDVEALLVRRTRESGSRAIGSRESGSHANGAAGPVAQEHVNPAPECLLVPIDACYRLVGIVRLRWKGFDGGADAWREIDAFFDGLRELARPVRDAVPASGPGA